MWLDSEEKRCRDEQEHYCLSMAAFGPYLLQFPAQTSPSPWGPPWTPFWYCNCPRALLTPIVPTSAFIPSTYFLLINLYLLSLSCLLGIVTFHAHPTPQDRSLYESCFLMHCKCLKKRPAYYKHSVTSCWEKKLMLLPESSYILYYVLKNLLKLLSTY